MEPVVGIGFLLLFAVAIVAFMSTRDQKNRERIEAEIRQAGGELLEISFKFVGYDRDNQHYTVRFTDMLGRKLETRCKVNIWNRGLFWQQTPAELLSDLPDNDMAGSQLVSDPGSSKEQLIDDLIAENERLRKQLVRAEPLSSDFK